jgi:molybdopterin molybdotransferase
MIEKKPSCDDMDTQSLTFEQALERVLQGTRAISTHRNVTIREAMDCVLAKDVTSPMDGYAVAGSDLPGSGEARLKVIGKSFAGHPYDGPVRQGECVRIMTGAVVPEGADTVIMQEHAEVDGNDIRITADHKKGQNVRHPGDDFSAGDTIIRAGERLTPAKLGLLASVGVTQLDVVRTPVVAFFSTGDELKAVGEPLQPGDIYDSNRYILFGMLKKMGVQVIDMGVIADVREQIELTLNDASACADMVITSGGASVGEADYIKQILDDIGEVNFWKIAMKPGKPLAFGKINNALFFGLPGNPVSAIATFYQFVQPCLRLLEGETPAAALKLKAKCLSSLKKRPGRKDFQRGILSTDENGELVVDTTGIQGSHMLSSMSKANCFIVLAREDGNIEPGTLVEVQPFNDLI